MTSGASCMLLTWPLASSEALLKLGCQRDLSWMLRMSSELSTEVPICNPSKLEATLGSRARCCPRCDDPQSCRETAPIPYVALPSSGSTLLLTDSVVSDSLLSNVVHIAYSVCLSRIGTGMRTITVTSQVLQAVAVTW